MIVTGRLAYNPRYIRYLTIKESDDGIMLKLFAVTDKGNEICLRKVNQWERGESAARMEIRRWYELYIREIDKSNQVQSLPAR